jgi:ketosteroid isomerase-like protein
MSEFKASASDTESVEVAKRRYLAYVDKDRAAMERLIAEDFHFTSPLDNRINRKTYFERCWPNSQRIAEFEFIGAVPDNDRVYLTYIGRSDVGRRFQNTELLTVRGGKIVEAEVYFGWSLPHPAPPGGFVESTPQA